MSMSSYPPSALALVASDEGWDLVERPLASLTDIPNFPSGLIRVSISRASISHAQAQVMSRQRSATPGRVLGHEAAGWVTEISPRAQRWLDGQGRSLSLGDRVVLFPFLPCLGVDSDGSPVDCPACSLGRIEECQRLKALGVDEDGVLTTFRDLPPQMVHRVPENVAPSSNTWIDLLYVEAIAQALVAAQSSALVSSRHIAVVGRGPVHELTARVIESVQFGWKYPFSGSPTPTPPAAALDEAVVTIDLDEGEIDEGPGLRASQQEAALAALRVHRLDPSALPRHPRAFDVIVETWADPASLSDMFQALRSNGVLIRKSRPGRAVSLLRQTAPLSAVRIVEAPYGSFASALAWMAAHPGALRDLDQDAHRYSLSTASEDNLDRVPLRSGQSFADGMGFPFSRGGILAALDADRRREQIGKIYLEIASSYQRYTP